jgi:hypothetical protein
MKNNKKFRKVYTVKQAKEDVRVEEMFAELGNMKDGRRDWWIHLSNDYVSTYMGGRVIHEQTVSDCLRHLNTYVVHVNDFNK